MNAKVLTVVVGLLLLVPVGYATSHSEQFGACSSGYECNETPDGGEFPPDAVTGHTVYASFVMEVRNEERDTLGLPTDFAAVAGYFNIIVPDNISRAIQRECVVWFNGKNLDQRPTATDNFNSNAFPSDEDEAYTPGGAGGSGDRSYQDYDFDRDVDSCLPEIENNTDPGNGAGGMTFAVVVEKGDCNPTSGSEFRFRAHLDFVDPNGIYHEVQEYDYVCSQGGPAGGVPIAGPALSAAVKDLFPVEHQPQNGNDPHNFEGCREYENPSNNNDIDPTVPTADPGHFDWGHKCNGSVQDLFTERLWITPIHATVQDPTLLKPYNFAIQVDTCSGINIYEGVPAPYAGLQGPGKQTNGTNNDGAEDDPANSYTRTVDQVDYFLDNTGNSDGRGMGLPLVEVCHDGSSFSFDDTPRGRIVHDRQPQQGDEDMMRGNSYEFDQNAENAGMHRQNCRSNHIDWPYNDYPGSNKGANFLGLTGNGPRESVGNDCYSEDHKTAQIDIYVYSFDPTGGLFSANSNGLTGPNAYVPSAVSDADYLP